MDPDNLTTRNPEHAFADAIATGVLTRKTAPMYMYMYTDRYRGDAFKHVDTRRYVYNNAIRYRLDYKREVN